MERQVHARASIKVCHAHIATHLVLCWDRGRLGCCGNPSQLVGNSRENLNIYISSHKHIQLHARLFFILFVFHSLQAEISPMRFKMNMDKTYPASMWLHVMAVEGTHPQPGQA